MVYPVSVFLYALLEEKRPKKNYWRFIIFYSSIILFLKFLLQTYPISFYLTNGNIENTGSGDDEISEKTTANDVLRTVRLGLEVIVEGKNFVNYFLFEALILLSVIFHMYIQIIGGVWDQREIDQESIQEAAVRIANIQREKALEAKGEEIEERPKRLIDNELKADPENDIVLVDHYQRTRKRSNSMNDVLNLREIRQDKKNRGDLGWYYEYPIEMDDWSDWEDEFAYGGEKYHDDEEIDKNNDEKINYIEYIRTVSRKEHIQERTREIKEIHEDFENNQDDEDIEEPKIKLFDWHLSEYEYSKDVKTSSGQPVKPTKAELTRFVIDNKPGESSVRKFINKLEIFFTHSSYFESLFPSIKEQKPGYDLYAPMATVQCIIILYMIIFYTRIDPDYTNVTADDLTPQQLNSTMVLAVFIQIAIIVLDRYLYLSRDYIVIDEIDVDGNDTDSDSDDDSVSRSYSISQFNRVDSIDLRHGSNSKTLGAALGIKSKSKAKPQVNVQRGRSRSQNKQPKQEPDGDDDGIIVDDINLRKTKFNKTIVLKYYLQLFLLVVIHLIVFWYFPIKANKSLQVTPYWDFDDPETGKSCNEVFMNPFLLGFYLLYCIYFLISALQIRYGLPEFRKGSFAMGDTGPINKAMFQGYIAIPFILELKIVSDWTFTRTSLDLFQWIKFEGVYADLFIAKCTNKAYIAHPLGEPMAFMQKLLLGWCGLFILILLIAGPLLFFSSFNPLAQDNLVTGAGLKVVLEANITSDGAVNEYMLFNTARFAALKPIDDDSYKNISSFRLVRNLDRKYFQKVVLSDVSDSTWDISPPAKKEIYERVSSGEVGQELPVNVVMEYAFDRPYPAGQQRIDKKLPQINIFATDTDPNIQKVLEVALNPDYRCDPNNPRNTFVMKDWLIPTIRLPQDIKPKLINIPQLKQNISITHAWENNEVTGVTSFWWEVTQDVYTGDTGDPNKEGVVFFTWSEKATDDIIGYSLLAFYAIVVLGIGQALRSGIQVDSNNIFVKDMPRPDSLLLICEGILISRMENNLEREEELFYVLIDIMRSPEILKRITDSSLKEKPKQE